MSFNNVKCIIKHKYMNIYQSTYCWILIIAKYDVTLVQRMQFLETVCEEVVQRVGNRWNVGGRDTEDEILQTDWRHWGELSLSRTAMPLCHCHALRCISPFYPSIKIKKSIGTKTHLIKCEIFIFLIFINIFYSLIELKFFSCLNNTNPSLILN